MLHEFCGLIVILCYALLALYFLFFNFQPSVSQKLSIHHNSCPPQLNFLDLHVVAQLQSDFISALGRKTVPLKAALQSVSVHHHPVLQLQAVIVSHLVSRLMLGHLVRPLY